MTHGPAGAAHDGHIKGRPISWVVVAVVCGGFLTAGIGVVVAMLWLFFVGAGVVAFGTILGWATHAMADVSTRVRELPADAAPAGAGTPAAPARDGAQADEPARS